MQKERCMCLMSCARPPIIRTPGGRQLGGSMTLQMLPNSYILLRAGHACVHKILCLGRTILVHPYDSRCTRL